MASGLLLVRSSDTMVILFHLHLMLFFVMTLVCFSAELIN